jgi:hypothetical protein
LIGIDFCGEGIRKSALIERISYQTLGRLSLRGRSQARPLAGEDAGPPDAVSRRISSQRLGKMELPTRFVGFFPCIISM